MIREEEENYVLFVGYAKLPEGITASELHKVITLVMVIDVQTGFIVRTDCSLATALSRTAVDRLLSGYNMNDGLNALQERVNAKYQGSAKKSIITALRIIFDKYNSYVQGDMNLGDE